MRHWLSIALLLFPVRSFPQEQRLPTEAEIRAAMALASPGAEHERLGRLAGTWDLELKLATGPATSLTVKGVAHNRMILGGRFLVSEARSLEPVMGQQLESMSVYGFDRRSNTYTMVGFDSFGTYFVEAEGAAAADAQTIVMPGVEVDPRTKREEVYDMILRIVDADTYVTAVVFKLAGGVEASAIEVTHRRRK